MKNCDRILAISAFFIKKSDYFRENIVGCRFRATVPVEKKEAAVTVNDGRFHSLAVL